MSGLEAKAIRHSIASALKGKTIAGNRVVEQRNEPIRPDVEGGPVLSVFTLDEDAQVQIDGPQRTYRVALELAVELFLEERPTADPTAGAADNRVDDLSAQVFCVVEPCIAKLEGTPIDGAPHALDLNPSESVYDRTDVGFDSKGRQIAGSARMVWTVTYARSVPLQNEEIDLEAVSIAWDFPPPDGETDAGDEIANLQT